MYSILLSLHSLIRWFVLISLIFSIVLSYKGWLSKKAFTRFDNAVRHRTATIIHIQLTLGICLYIISPIVSYFLHHFEDAVRQREIRFFGMEHSFMMLTAVTVVTIGSAKAKRKPNSTEKFKTMAIWFTIGLLIILTSVPWPFSPFTSRPYLRSF